VHWIPLVQDRGQWQVIVSNVMNLLIPFKPRNYWSSEQLSVSLVSAASTHVGEAPLRGQHTPGTKRLLKQMDCLRLPRSKSNWGQLLRSSHVPVRPSGVVHGLLAAALSASVPLLGRSVTRGGKASLTIGAIVSVTLGPRTFLLIV
jgi:hypothetical protein